MSGSELVGMLRAVFEWASLVIEVLGAGIIVAHKLLAGGGSFRIFKAIFRVRCPAA